MKKWIKSILLMPMITMPFMLSCGENCDHKKGEIQSILLKNKQNILRTGEFECSECGKRFYAEIEPEDIMTPIINLDGDINNLGDDEKRTIQVHFLSTIEQENFDCDAEIKLQGHTSKWYPKKNYNLTFYRTGTKDKLKIKFLNWPEMSKFTLKADWVDCHHIRNVGLAKIWGQLIRSSPKQSADDILYDTVNAGATDGFPILVYNNNVFLGLYLVTIPKSKYLTGMQNDDLTENRFSLFCAERLTTSTQFKETIDKNTDWDLQGWDLEYHSLEDEGWVIDSFNQLINIANNTNDEYFKTIISQYIDLDRTIDYICFINMFCCVDNRSNNINWCTYNGTKWIPIPWDLDQSFGYYNTGEEGCYNYDHQMDFSINNLFDRIVRLFNVQYKARLQELKQTIFEPQNVIGVLSNLYWTIFPLTLETDLLKWPTMPSKGDDFLFKIKNWYEKRWEWIN